MTKFKIKVDIPEILIAEVNKFPFKKEKSKEHALRLIAVTLYHLNEEEEDINCYYKPLSARYIRDKITTHLFYKDYFLRFLQGQEDEEDFPKKIFQTDGSYCPRFYSKYYRINPEYLTGPTKEIEVEIEFDCLNDVFPYVIAHFNYSASLIKPKIERGEMNEQINELSLQMGLMANGANSGFFNRSLSDAISVSDKTIKLPEKIKLQKENYASFNKLEIEAEVQKRKKESLKPGIILVHEKDKKNKNRFEISDLDEYFTNKRKRFLKRVHSGIDRIIRHEWTPSISEANGRFNHQLTYLDKFCVDFFNLDNEAIASFDLKSSQPTILANLLIQNPKLLTSIKNSKYEKLVLFLKKNESVFFYQEEDAWLNDFVGTDIYKTIADELGITRGEAKKEMMFLIFTEANVPSNISEALSKLFPEFINGLKAIKKSFKREHGSSKKTLPLFLQFLEAHIFVEVIYEEIAKAKIPAITKHDCILFPVSREREIKTIIESCFGRLGLVGQMVLEEKKELQINEWPEEYKPSKIPI
jgi:hypothetical protein